MTTKKKTTRKILNWMVEPQNGSFRLLGHREAAANANKMYSGTTQTRSKKPEQQGQKEGMEREEGGRKDGWMEGGNMSRR